MHVFVTGGTGFVGSALVLRLLRDGHSVSVWTRRPEHAPALVGGDVDIIDARKGRDTLVAELERADAVIHLAGESVVSRWTAERMKQLRASRIDVTRELVEAMKACRQPPRVFLSASAVGYYGSDLGETFDEDSPPANDFLAQLCVDWEAAAQAARGTGARVCQIRIGIVLGPGGGALASMLPVFELGLGGRLGSGRQWMSWIHLDDLAEVFAKALENPSYEGAINGVGPSPATNREFTQTLASVLNRPAILPVPSIALRAIFGRGARALLASQRVEAKRLAALDFEFRHPTLRGALEDATHRGTPTVQIEPAINPPSHPYLERRGATYVLRQETLINDALERVFPFFSEAANLGTLTPPDMEFRILTERPIAMASGTEIDYRIRLGPLPMRWKTVIERWLPGLGFVDAQHRGPYRAWFHEHEFEAVGDQTRMVDRVWYRPPLGPIGRIVHALFIGSMLRRIFEYRASRVRLRFGAEEKRHDLAA
ncbi:MAG: TIGR01777 family oxidoreductase [Myxococcota bacterium]